MPSEGASRIESMNTPQSPASSIESASEPEIHELIELQTRKCELTIKRNALAAKKASLSEELKIVKEKFTLFKEQRLKQETKKKMDFLLHQNGHEVARLSEPDQAASFVLDNLEIISSQDWDLKRDLWKRMNPHVIIDRCFMKKNPNKGNNNHSIFITLSATGLPSLLLCVEVSHELVSDLKVSNWNTASSLLQGISPSYRSTIELNYISQRKLDLLLYSYQSLAQLQKERIGAYSKILRKYACYISQPPSDADWESDAEKRLLCIPYVQLTVPYEGKVYIVRLFWSLVIQNSICGEVTSCIGLKIFDAEMRLFNDSSDAYLHFLEEYGVVKALDLILTNVFQIQP